MLCLIGRKIARRQLRLQLAVQQYQILLKKPVLHYWQLGEKHTATMDDIEHTQFEDERRKWKLNTVKYRELDKETKKKCRERREEWVLQKCDEIEDLEETNSLRVYDKINELGSKKGISRKNIIKDKDGNILVEVDEITNRREE